MSNEDQKTAAIVAAAGMGTRMGGGISKQRMLLGGKTILAHAVERLCASGVISECIVVVPAGELGLYKSLVEELWNKDDIPIRCVEGGTDRMGSIRKGLEQISKEVGLVLIHDGARPFVSLETIHACVGKALETGAAVAAVPAKDTIKVASADGVVESTPDRSRLFLVQTPQVFRRDWLEQAHRLAAENGWDATDDSALIERLGHRVYLVKGSYFNLKITTPEDMVMAEGILAAIAAAVPVNDHRQKHFQGTGGNAFED